MAIMTMLSPFESICVSFYMGFSSAAGIILGQNLGAKRFETVWKQSWFFVAMAVVLGMTLGTVFFLMRDLILSNFSGMDQNTMSTARDVCLVFACGLWMKAINILIITGILRSGGDTRFCLYQDVFSHWIVGIPLGILGAFVWKMPLEFVFALVHCKELAKLFLCLYRMASKVWIQNLIDPQCDRNKQIKAA